MDLEFWNSVFKSGAMWLGLLTAIAAGGGWWTESIVGARQADRIRVLERDIADAKGKQAEAEGRLASVELESQKQRERAADAERRLEEERAARVGFDRIAANRWIEPETFNAMVSAMSKFPGQRAEVVVFPVTFESQNIARLIHGILGNAKWNAGDLRLLSEPPTVLAAGSKPGPLMVQGVYIQSTADTESKEAAHALFHELSSTVASGIHNRLSLPDGPPRVLVFVGDKPTPLSVWVK